MTEMDDVHENTIIKTDEQEISNINDDIVKKFGGAIEYVQTLIKEAVSHIKPEVELVIRNRSTDSKHIKNLLDRLLDYAGMDESGLVLFKRGVSIDLC